MDSDKKFEGLFTSVSQVKTFLRCPRLFELRYVRGLAPAFVPIPLAFGSAFHKALAGHYRSIQSSGTPLTLDRLHQLFRDAWTAALDGPIPLQVDPDEDEEPAAVVDKGVAMLTAFHTHAAHEAVPTVVQVEEQFTVDLHDPDTGELLEEKLLGVMDLVVQEDGRRIVVEHKTAARKFSLDQLRYDFQPTAYAFAARQLGWGEVGTRFQVVTKTKVPAVQVENVLRDEGDEDDFLRIVGGVLRSLDAGVSFAIRGFGCRTCAFAYACRGARP